ncbi:MAG: glycosyltransferase [Phycisphaerales bacterium]
MNKTIHRIWLNEEPPPPALQRIGESWDGEDVRLWTLDDVAKLDRIADVMRLARKVWKKNYKALADIVRLEVLRIHGGLYVDMDCELVGDSYLMWSVIRSELLADRRDTVLFRPARPRQLDHPRCCNGVMYHDPGGDAGAQSMMGIAIEAAHARIDLVASQLEHRKRLARPMDACGPYLMWYLKRRFNLPMVAPPFSAFKSVATPDTRIIIHQGWRQYDA